MASVIFVLFLIVVGGISIRNILRGPSDTENIYADACPQPLIEQTDIYFHGSELNLDNETLDHILSKRFCYYRELEPDLQVRFIYRLRDFMRKKHFIIKDKQGVREMPVLVSAAAIQLTFGLDNYLLPFYQYIRIYPEEYLSDHSFAILAGNVQNNVITIAWNQLLLGFENADGSNVGLHEMSHALYNQQIVLQGSGAKNFSDNYDKLVVECSEASRIELDGRKNLYSEYADTNIQEFWAETVEIFFEKPEELASNYPDVFEAMTLVMNQDTRRKTNPVLSNNLSFNEKLQKLTGEFAKRVGLNT